MYLKQIEIYGFKSFATKAVIKFDNEVTGIVGPNGSGKSNIVDAVRWVLGEQRVKSLRGGKMEDVIFSGSEQKRALGYAFVNITIDNSTGILPVEYDEVNVSRRLYRSGESEYYINRKAVRLRDVQELFMDTGLSREGYSIISQGKIESIVNNSAVERKLMIEEAVGIVKYKSRKKEATRKLERTSANLVRLNDIVSELEKRLPALKRNSRKARKYLDMAERLKSLELNLFVHRADEYTEKIDRAKDAEAVMGDNLVLLERQIDTLDANYTELKNRLSEYDEKINSANSELHDFISNYDNAKIEIEVNRNTIEMLTQTIHDLEEASRNLLMENEEREEELSAVNGEIEEREDAVKKLTETLEGIKAEVERLKNISQEREDALARENVALRTKERMLDGKRKFLSESISRMDTNEYIIDSLTAEIAELEKDTESFEEDSSYEEIAALEEKLEKLDSENNALLEERYKIEEARADYKDALLEKYNGIKLLKNKRDLLVGYEQNKEGYRFGVKKLFERRKTDSVLEKEIFGTIGDIISVDKKYAQAIQKALGATVEHVVVKDENTAAAAIELLKKHRWGRVTFLPSNIIRPRDGKDIEQAARGAKGYEGLGSDFVRYSRKYDNIVRNALGNTLVFDTLDNANRFAAKSRHRYKIVTLDGEVLYPGGALVGGRGKSDESSLLSRKNEIEKLENRIRKEIAAYNEEIKKAASFEKSFEEIDEKINEKGEKISTLTLEITRKEEKITQRQEAFDKALSLIEEKKKEIEKRKTANVKISEMNEKDRTEIEKLQAEIENRKTEIEDISKGLYKDKHLEMMEKLHAEEMNMVKEEEALRLLREKKSSILSLSQKNLDDISANAQEISDSEKQIEGLEEKITEAENLDRDYETLRQGLDSRYQQLIDEKQKTSDNFEKTGDELKDLQEERYLLSEKIQKSSSEREKLSLRMEYLQQGIMEDYNMTYAQAEEYRNEDVNIQEVEENVTELKQQMKKLGNVNIDSIEEYKEVRDRFEFLNGQKEDLEGAKNSLLDIIADINLKMEDKFSKEFVNINREFNQVFQKLFNGGSASLELTDPENIMDSGIDIVASLPRKKTKNISSLSGGEKSLTAIALILAILKLKPAPFCILDEIDAALDDANVVRFCNYMKSIIKDNQFIIVTHRKITMGIADVLYGATMGSEGFTRIVSVRLKDVREGGVIQGAQ